MNVKCFRNINTDIVKKNLIIVKECFIEIYEIVDIFPLQMIAKYSLQIIK